MNKLVPVIVTFVLLPCGVESRELAPYAGIKYESHSNVTRSSTNEVSDSLIAPYAGVVYEDGGDGFNSKVNGEVTYETYVDDTYSQDTKVKLDAYYDWIVVPGRFSWTVEDYADIYRINIQGSDTPANMQTVNVFAVGPDFLFSNEYADVLLKGRYENVTYSNTDEDNQRILVAASAKRYLNPVSALNLDSTISLVDFNSDFGNDYNVLTTGLRYERDLPFGFLTGAVGYNGFDFDFGKSKNDPYYDLSIVFELGGSGTVELSGAFKLTDIALEALNPLYTRLLDDLEINKLLQLTKERGGSGVYRVNRGFASYSYQGDIAGFSAYAYSNQQRYFGDVSLVDNNFNETGAGVFFGYQLPSGINLFAGGNVSNAEYLESAEQFDVDVSSYQVGGTYQVSDNINLDVRFINEDSQSLNLERDYQDSITAVSLEYRIPVNEFEAN